MTEENISTDYTGKFCWEEIDGIAVPFIIRPSGVMLAELNMLKQTLFRKHVQVFSDSTFNIACPTVNMSLLFRMTDNEKALLDEINVMHCEKYFSRTPYSKYSNFLMRQKDAIKLYQIFEVFHDIVVNEKFENSKCGFMKIDSSNTPVPFVDVEDVGLVVPLFFFECPEVTEIAFDLSDHWSTTYLRLCCKLLSISPTLYNRESLLVVTLDSLKTVVPEVNHISTFGSLPSKVKLTHFLRHESKPKVVASKETDCMFNQHIEKYATSMSQTIRKRPLEQSKPDGNAAKRVKLENNRLDNTRCDILTINYSSDNEDFAEETITIKIDPVEPNTPFEASKFEKPQKLFDNKLPDPILGASNSPQNFHSPNQDFSHTTAASEFITGSSTTSFEAQLSNYGCTSKSHVNKVRIPRLIDRRKEIRANIPSRKSIVSNCPDELKAHEHSERTKVLNIGASPLISPSVTSSDLSASNIWNTLNSVARNTDIIPQLKATSLVTSTYIPVLGACNGPGVITSESILRSIGNVGKPTDILIQQPGIMTHSITSPDLSASNIWNTINSVSRNTDIIPQSIATSLVTSTYIPVLGACNGPGVITSESILRSIGNVGKPTDILIQQPGIMTHSITSPDLSASNIWNTLNSVSRNTDIIPQSIATSLVTSTYIPVLGACNGPGVITSESILRSIGNVGKPTDILIQQPGIMTHSITSPDLSASNIWNTINSVATNTDIIPQSIATSLVTSTYIPVLGACNGPGVITSESISRPIGNVGKPTEIFIQQPGIMTHSSGLSTHIPTVMIQEQQQPLVNLSGGLMQQHMGTVKQAGTLVHQPGTMIVGPAINPLVQQPSFMTVSTGNQQQRNVVFSGMDSRQGAQTFLARSSCPAMVKTLNKPAYRRPQFSVQHSQVNATNSLKISKAGLRSNETQSTSELTSLKGFKEIKCNPGVVNILPKMSNNKQLFSNTFCAGSNTGTSGIVAQPSINSLSFTEVAKSAHNSANMLILQPSNSAAQSGIMTHLSGGFAPNTSLMGLSTQNFLGTPAVTSSENINNCWGFLGNVANMPHVPNSGPILTNQSGFMINSNNLLSTSSGILVTQPNMSSFQNVFVTANGLIVCPNVVPNPSSTLVSETNMIPQPKNVVFQSNYSAYQKAVTIPKSSQGPNKTGTGTAINKTNIVTQPNKLVPFSNDMANHRTSQNFSAKNPDKCNESANHYDYIKREVDGDTVSNEWNNTSIKSEPNPNLDEKFNIAHPDPDETIPSSNTVIKTELENIYDAINNKSKKSGKSNVIDLTDDDNVSILFQDKKPSCTIISDENMEKLVVWEGKDRKVLYKVIEIPEFKNTNARTSYKVVTLKIQKCHNFMCISLDPFDHERLLISVLEVTDKLFPEISRKIFMSIAKQVKLEVYSLNSTQKAVLQRFYGANNGSDVSGHLYFLYKKFIVIYESIKRVSQRVLQIQNRLDIS